MIFTRSILTNAPNNFHPLVLPLPFLTRQWLDDYPLLSCTYFTDAHTSIWLSLEFFMADTTGNNTVLGNHYNRDNFYSSLDDSTFFWLLGFFYELFLLLFSSSFLFQGLSTFRCRALAFCLGLLFYNYTAFH